MNGQTACLERRYSATKPPDDGVSEVSFAFLLQLSMDLLFSTFCGSKTRAERISQVVGSLSGGWPNEDPDTQPRTPRQELA